MKKVAIIGGGASGFMAAITIGRLDKNRDIKITIYERQSRVGKKLLATGNGTCNITNRNCDISRYHGDYKLAERVIESFNSQKTEEFFKSIGVICTAKEDGRVYPYSKQASSVLDCLRAEAVRLDIEEKCDSEIVGIKKTKSGFFLSFKGGDKKEFADAVLISAGGKASPSLGGVSSGYELLGQLGHTSTALYPALVQVKTDGARVKPLKGIKFDGNATVYQNGKPLKTESGEILFTEYGLSGPPIFQLSRIVSLSKNSHLKISLDLMPEFSFEEILELLQARHKNMQGECLENFFTGMLNKRLGQTLLKQIFNIQLSEKVEFLNNGRLKQLAGAIKSWEFEIGGTLSWQNSQVTAGGVPLLEFDIKTLQSMKCQGLFAAGEVLNVDGDCGGFNLQWAWSSGYVSGKGIYQYLMQ